MKDATLRQSAKILGIFEDTPCEQIQAILASGLLADLRDGNIHEVNREEYRKILGLKPLNLPLLAHVGTVDLPALPLFRAKDKFVRDTLQSAMQELVHAIGGLRCPT